jgi:hypothetical protein
LAPDAVLALQRHVGNAAVTALLRTRRTPTPVSTGLTAVQARASVADVHRRFSRNSIQTIQEIMGGWADGKWTASWSSSLASWQQGNQIAPADAIVRAGTLDRFVTEAVARGWQTQVIHLVADFFDLDTRSSTLSIRFDATLPDKFFVQSSWGLGRVFIGAPAMHTSATIKAALDEALTPMAQTQGSKTPQTGMQPDDASKVAAENGRMLRDERSVRAIQGLLGANPTGVFDADTSHRVADFQAKENLSTAHGDEGRIYLETFKRILDKLIAGRDQDLAIRLTIDWYRIKEDGVIDIRYDPRLISPFSLQAAGRPAPSVLTFGQLAFGFGHESLVHDIDAGCTQARLHASGTSPMQGVFLAMRARVMSQVIDVFATDPDPAKSAGFVFDARRALDAFLALNPEAQLALNKRFETVRERVLERYAEADPADRKAHAALLAEYKAVAISAP